DPSAETDGVAYTVFGYTEGESRARVRSLRTREFAYIQYYEGHDVLFAADDPEEAVDLSEDPAYAELVATKRRMIESGRTATWTDADRAAHGVE
ncbi:MAG: hypothetical protein AAF078_14740, partial [Planctomycetota bacterium]